MNRKQKFLLLLYIKRHMSEKRRQSAKFLQNFLFQAGKVENEIVSTSLFLSMMLMPAPRRYWMMTYEQHWFEKIWQRRHDEIYCELFVQEFRMKGTTFDYIVGLVAHAIEKHHTTFRQAVDVNKRVAVAIWRLSTNNSYRTVSKVFGISKAVCIKITQDFRDEIVRIASEFIKFPKNGPDTATAIQHFKEFADCRIPQVMGALDGTHIEIEAPPTESKVDYFSRKQKYTVNTQAVIGANLMFLHVATGFPGSIHDARMCRATSVFQEAENGQILATPTDVINGYAVRPLILGDSAYPCTNWILKPFNFNLNLTQDQKKYNRKVSASRSTIERAFGLLKVRWRCLLKRMDDRLENVPKIIITCCVLHNICQKVGDHYIDRENILPIVLNQERRARVRRARQHFVCDDGNVLQDIMVNYIANN